MQHGTGKGRSLKMGTSRAQHAPPINHALSTIPSAAQAQDEAARLVRRLIASRPAIHDCYVAMHGEPAMVAHIAELKATGADDDTIIVGFDNWMKSKHGCVARGKRQEAHSEVSLDQQLLNLLAGREAEVAAVLADIFENKQHSTGNAAYGIMANAARTIQMTAQILLTAHQPT